MKGFERKETRFSLCGLNCGLCVMRTGGYCPGCGGGPGNQSCALARCSLTHGGPEFCWECAEYPCHRYEGFDRCDSFLPHSTRQRDIARARELGLPGYLAELDQRREILRQLMEGWNDGRRKTLFHTAAVLLPLEELQGVMAALPQGDALPIKERTKAAAALLEEAAARRGLSLKLRKRPEKEQK